MPRSGVAVSRGDRNGDDERSAIVGVPRDPGDSRRQADVAGGVPGRRTVTIRGQGAERYTPRSSSSARHRSERRHERAGFRPDRAAMWAVLLGLLLILAAATSAHAAMLHALVASH
jgi:hypothetical protein